MISAAVERGLINEACTRNARTPLQVAAHTPNMIFLEEMMRFHDGIDFQVVDQGTGRSLSDMLEFSRLPYWAQRMREEFGVRELNPPTALHNVARRVPP